MIVKSKSLALFFVLFLCVYSVIFIINIYQFHEHEFSVAHMNNSVNSNGSGIDNDSNVNKVDDGDPDNVDGEHDGLNLKHTRSSGTSSTTDGTTGGTGTGTTTGNGNTTATTTATTGGVVVSNNDNDINHYDKANSHKDSSNTTQPPQQAQQAAVTMSIPAVPLPLQQMYKRAKWNQQFCHNNHYSTHVGGTATHTFESQLSNDSDNYHHYEFPFIKDWEQIIDSHEFGNDNDYDSVNKFNNYNGKSYRNKNNTIDLVLEDEALQQSIHSASLSSSYTVILSYTPIQKRQSLQSSTNDKTNHYHHQHMDSDNDIDHNNDNDIDSSNSSFRILFVNLMSLLTFQHVDQIIILYHGQQQQHHHQQQEHEFIQQLKQDPLYGKRIWDWHTNLTNPIRILTQDDIIHSSRVNNATGTLSSSTNTNNNNTSLFNHILFPFHPLLLNYIHQDTNTILYLNQNDNDNHGSRNSQELILQKRGILGGEETFNAGYTLTTLSPLHYHSLVARDELHVQKIQQPNSISTNHSSNSDIHIDDFTTTTSMSTSSSSKNNSNHTTFIPQCNANHLYTQKQQQQQQQQQHHNTSPTTSLRIMSSSGIFLPKKYFTLIWHPLLKPFRSSVQNKYQQYSQQLLLPLVHTNYDNNMNDTESKNKKHNNIPTMTSIESIHQLLHLIQSISISTLITQFSNNHPLVYPIVRQTWDDSTNRNREKMGTPHHNNNNNIEMTTNTTHHRRRLSVALDGVISAVSESNLNVSIQNNLIENITSTTHHQNIYNNHQKEVQPYRRRRKHDDDNENDNKNESYEHSSDKSSSSSEYAYHHRRLLEKSVHDYTFKPSNNVYHLLPHDYDFLIECMSYFGSFPSDVFCWCDDISSLQVVNNNSGRKVMANHDKDNGSFMMKENNINELVDCESKCQVKSVDLSLSMLPWMKKKVKIYNKS